MSPFPAVILLVDDDDCFRRALAIALRLDGFRVLEAATAHEALRHLQSEPVSLAVVDMLLGGEHGDDVLELTTRHRPDARLVSISGHPEMPSRAALAGQAIHLEKPIVPSTIIALLGEQVAAAVRR